MCDIDLKTCEKSSKYKKKDIVDLGKKCGVLPYLPDGREKTRKAICTEIVNRYESASSSSESDDDERNFDSICDITEKECKDLNKVDVLALGEHCGVNIYTDKGNFKPINSICKSIAKSPVTYNLMDMDIHNLKKIAKQLNINYKNKGDNELYLLIKNKINTLRSVSPSSSESSLSPLTSGKYGYSDLAKKKMVELQELAKSAGLRKWKWKIPSKMLKQDYIDFLLNLGDKQPSPVPCQPLLSIQMI